jgi:acylphosphatase
MMEKCVSINLKGKVQGVNFRNNTRQMANSLGIYGFVKNMPDGSVHIEAEGEEDKLQEFMDWCSKGPNAALVENVEYEYIPEKNFQDFSIRY